MRTKYFNDAFVGNGRVTASFSKTGELLRLYYPTIDYKQFFEEFYLGVKINDSALIYLHNDINNSYEQEYLENTNILRTDKAYEESVGSFWLNSDGNNIEIKTININLDGNA